MKLNKLLLLGCLPFLFVSCNNDDDFYNDQGTGEKVKIELDVQQRVIQKKGNDFANRLMAHVIKENENALVSPLSLQVALGMLANGANEQACNEISATLGLQDYSLYELNRYHQVVMGGIINEQDPKVELALSNSLWLSKNLTAKENFINNLQTYYGASLNSIDFSKAEQAKREINSWANEATKGMIKDLQLPVSTSTAFVLSNACYFDGQWFSPFDKKDTFADFFTTEYGNVQKVSMMHKHEWTIYTENENYQLVYLGFGNASFGIMFVLPKEGKNIKEVLPSIDWDISNITHTNNVDLSLPKFKMEILTELNKTLQDMGIRTVFESNSFPNISDNLALAWAQQNACFEIDESGVKASTVTSVEGLEQSSGPTNVTMKIDRPFLFAIRENSSGALLYMGKIASVE